MLFTFQYGATSTSVAGSSATSTASFTFQYGATSTHTLGWQISFLNNLHSNMELLLLLKK